MAIHIMELNGMINNVVFYRRNGKNFARKKPRKYKRTRAMKARSRNFGIAQSTAATLRRMLDKLIPFPADKGMQSTFSGGLAKWIGGREIKDILPENNIAYLGDFQFNEKCKMRNRWKTQLSVLNPSNGLLQLHLPAFTPVEAIIAPENTVSVTLQVSVAAAKLESGGTGTSYATSMEIPYDEAETGPYLIDLPIEMERGTLLITACALQYNVRRQGIVNTIIYNKPDHMPAAVVEARYC